MSNSFTTFSSAIAAPKTWLWKGFPICYQVVGNTGPAVVLVHGFGASWGHWRKNLPVLGETCRCYAIDLIGFGGSAKPTPDVEIDYTFETWGEQVADFCREVVGGPAFLVGNSIGGDVVLQTAVEEPELVLGVALLNCSLRLLHYRRNSLRFWYEHFTTSVVQQYLNDKAIGYFFYEQITQPMVIRSILRQAYCRQEAVTDELIKILLQPAADKGAADVFLAFSRYTDGPLPEDLLPLLSCPAIIVWGVEDQWEPLILGRKLVDFPAVKQFITLDGVGHCPHDEAPELVNPILQNWILSLSKEN